VESNRVIWAVPPPPLESAFTQLAALLLSQACTRGVSCAFMARCKVIGGYSICPGR
jgi:hypothetical protein